MKTCFLFFLVFWCAFEGIAQSKVDTTGQLDSIVVLAKAVTPLGQPSTIKREAWQTGKLASNLTEALLYLPGVHIRQNGPGQIATLQYRGLQGARIAQTWQGIPVTNPQIGSSDANELSLALVDQIALGSPTDIGNAAAVAVSQTTAGPTSFTARYSEGKGYFVNGQWRGLRVFYQNDQYDFPHSFSGREYRTSDTGNETNAIGAAFTANYDREWSSSTYFLRSVRNQSQFAIDHGTNTYLETTTARQLFTVIQDTSERFDFGILFDNQVYFANRNLSSKGTTFQALIQYQTQLLKDLRLTTDNRAVISKHTDYTESSILPETRTLITYEKSIGGLKLEATSGIHARLNSGTVVFGSASLHKKVTSTESVRLIARRIGRIPTLDDLLWAQGGDKDLAPERGWEISTSSEGKLGTAVITPILFARRFSNYILWLPRGAYWTPYSIPAVNNFGAGIDISGRIGSINSHHFKYLGSLNYSELRLAKDQILSNGTYLVADENLPFSPKFTGNVTLDYRYRRWSCLAQGRYTGKQQTSYNGLSEFDDFAVLRAAISHQLNVLSISLSCDNLTNTVIPIDFGLYSPLRRFELTLNYTPKK